MASDDACAEFGYAIKDLMNSLHLTTRYTAMRRQFKTMDDSKEERPIVSYQAVGSRIVDGYALLFSLAYLRQKIINMPLLKSFIRPYIPHFNPLVMERVIDLRECCGGFGFMQISGHPGFIARNVLRSAQRALTSIPEIPELMKRIHYFTSDLSLYPKYMENITANSCKPKDILGLFCIVCMNMKKNREQMGESQYMKEFFLQSSYQSMYTSINYYPVLEEGQFYVVEELLLYSMLSYVIKHSRFIDWSFCSVSVEEYTESIMGLRN